MTCIVHVEVRSVEVTPPVGVAEVLLPSNPDKRGYCGVRVAVTRLVEINQIDRDLDRLTDSEFDEYRLFAEILAAAENGEETTILKSGKAAARVVAVDEQSDQRRAALHRISELRQRLKSHPYSLAVEDILLTS